MVVQENSMREQAHLIGVVDDDPRVLNGLQQLLESVGYDVLSFQSANGLLASNNLDSINCVITDIGMPEVNGFELREILSREHPQLPVILITGRYELIENLPPESDMRILRKPFDSITLLSTISDCLAGTGLS
ncbi:FixJ family two-component response regulator [Rhizobium sp. BIGb0125]|uniref:response regulator transcription factor n=1 Tax=Rhizobium sp. BIGb0125 TaxID=2940618 RepID=UPI002166F7FA|nr:response regulator [Rhizobium sp. BIGb0125]MCS4243071.1 FixJ family two-component response regulator [Rhizobium sp. BIGb0125]